MADLTDAEIAARLAEVMGLEFEWSRRKEKIRIVHIPGEVWRVFNPLADTDAGWADFGRVWEWAEDQDDLPTRLAHARWLNSLADSFSTKEARRALCLAILKAEGRA